MGYEDLARARQEEDTQWTIRFHQLRQDLGKEAFHALTTVQRKFEWSIFYRRNHLTQQRALWDVRLEQLREHLGEEIYSSLTWVEREAAWNRLDQHNPPRKRREEVPADLATEERLAEDERAGDSLPYLTAADLLGGDYSREKDNHWAPFRSWPGESIRKPVRRVPKLVREAAGEEETTIIEEAPEPKATKTQKPTKPKLFAPEYEFSQVNEAYNQSRYPGLSPNERKDKLAQANLMLKALQRDIWNSLEVKKREEHLSGAPLPATKAFKEVKQEESAGWEGEDSEAEDSEDSGDEAVVTVAESPEKKPVARAVPAAQKTPSRKRKATGEENGDEQDLLVSETGTAPKTPTAKKPAAKKPRITRGKTPVSRAKLNPSLLLSPPSTSEPGQSVSPDQRLRVFDASKLLDGTSVASAALAIAIAEETPAPAIPPATPAPKKRGRPRKNAAVAGAGTGTTSVNTEAPPSKKRGRPRKNQVP